MQETILINGQQYDPYFILDCVPEDSQEKVNKAFRKKAKIWHPDKLSQKDRNDPEKVEARKERFKILVDCYDYISGKKSNFVNNNSSRQEVNIPRNNNIPTKNLDNTHELENFNKEFEQSRVQTPNDFGYSTERIKDPKDYDNFEYKPSQLFESKSFNTNDFNNAFEYNQENQGLSSSKDVGVYFKTTDGFNAYNAGDSGAYANVSSFNGVMIVGDEFGQTGAGYFDANYSDYKQVFSAPKNPNKINVPNDFESKMNAKVKALSNKETQEQMFLDKQQNDIKEKINQDREFVLQYRNMYKDQNTIDNAINNSLICSPDYCDEESLDKRNLRTKF